MATYTVQAPDGKTVTLEGPDGASQDDVISQAQKLYQPSSAASPTPAPARPKLSALRQNDAQKAWDDASADLERQIVNLPDKFKAVARDNFFKDPRIAQLREAAATPFSQKQGADTRSGGQRKRDFVRDRTRPLLAMTSAAPLTLLDNATQGGIDSGIVQAGFGIPERIGAGLSSKTFEEVKGDVQEEADRAPVTNFLAQVLPSLVAGTSVGEGLSALTQGTRVGRAANAFATALPRTARAATAVGGGAAAGALDALGRGEDVGTGAATGAVAVPAIIGGAKVLKVIARPFAEMIKSPSAEKIIRRFTKASAEDMRAAADRYRAQTGAEPTLYELLPQADRNKLAEGVIGRDTAASERAANAVRSRVANVGPEMQNTVRAATGDERNRIIGMMADDLDAARGTTDAAPLPGVANAGQGPLPMKDFQQQVDRGIMDPVNNIPVADDLESLMPSTPELQANGDVNYVVTDPEMAAAIRNAAGSLRLRRSPEDLQADISGLTANDAATIIQNLGKKKPGQDGYGAAQRAIPHLLDVLEERSPESVDAINRMRAAHAANARRLEGLAEGGMGRTRATAPIQDVQAVRNAYDSPEGAQGRFLGQGNRVEQQMGGTNRDALGATDDIAESGNTQAALRGNLGGPAANTITAAAEAQQRNLRKLSSLSKEKKDVEDSISLVDIGKMALALNPGSMPATKLFALSRLTTLSRLPSRKAQTIVDMLLSQDPAITNRAISVLNKASDGTKKFLQDFGRSMVVGQLANEVAQGSGSGVPGVSEAKAADTSDIDALLQENTSTEEAIPSDGGQDENPDVPHGRAVVEALFPEAHITDDERDPNSKLGRENPGSYHVKTDEAVDVRPIPGMTFEEFIETIKDNGYEILEAINEDENGGGKRSRHATGNHWHVVIS